MGNRKGKQLKLQCIYKSSVDEAVFVKTRVIFVELNNRSLFTHCCATRTVMRCVEKWTSNL